MSVGKDVCTGSNSNIKACQKKAEFGAERQHIDITCPLRKGVATKMLCFRWLGTKIDYLKIGLSKKTQDIWSAVTTPQDF